MKNNKKIIMSAVAGLVATGLVVPPQAVAKIHCKGIATKWNNSCEANGHACGGAAKTHFDKNEFLDMGKDDCKAVQKALRSEAVRNYVIGVHNAAYAAAKKGKK